MLERLVEFIRLLRQNGVRVSVAETLDALSAVERVGLADPATLAGALQATLVKREADQAAFDELYDLFFFRRGAFLDGEGEPPPLVAALREAGLSEAQIEALLAIIADEAARLGPVARASLGLRRTSLAGLIRLAGVQVDFERLQNPLQVGFFTQQLLEQLDVRGAGDELARLGERLGEKMPAGEAAEVLAHARRNLERLRTQVRGYVKDEFERRNVQFVEQMRQQILAHKPFSAMSEADLVRLRAEVVRLARRLRELASLRPRTRRRGRLDARRTLRRALATGGVPFRLKYRHRRVDKPRLMILCDVSDSVRHVSRFMLYLAYTLQERFSQVRSFVFVSDVGECTDFFRRHELARAVELAWSGGVINVYANSNFGRAFRLFVERHLDAVTPKTTVIVIGDGRNNYNPPEAWALAAIGERARRLLWLNPEAPVSWAFGDSAMREYEPHCDRVEVVNNLASLAGVADSLVL